LGLAVLEIELEELQRAQGAIRVSVTGSSVAFNETMHLYDFEVIRFAQSLGSPFLNSHGLRLMKLAVDVVSQSGVDSAASQETAGTFRTEARRLTDRTQYGLSCLDLLESAAELEAHRGYMNQFSVVGRPTPVTVYRDLQERIHPDPEASRRKGFDWVADRLGPDEAFELMAPLTFLAFLADDPVGRFMALAFDATGTTGTLMEATGEQLLAWAGADYVSEYLAPIARGEPIGTQFVAEPLRAALEIWGASALIEAFCRPSIHLPRLPGDPATFGHVLPPVLVFSSSRSHEPIFLRKGIAGRDPSFAYDIIRHAAILASAQRLVTSNGQDVEAVCWHRQCPVFPTGLCFRWFKIPSREEGHDTCFFPVEFGRVAGLTPVAAWSRRVVGA